MAEDHPAMAPGLTTRERLNLLSEHELKMYHDRKARMYRDRAWMVDALCRTKGADLWFPERNSANRSTVLLHSERVAKALCVRCPVRRKCLEYGKNENDGIWGGTLPRERGRYRYRANGKEQLSLDELLDEMDEQAFELGLVDREEKAG